MIESIRVNGIEMDYAVFGDGKTPMVIIPGVSLHSVLRMESLLQNQFRRFTDCHTVYIFDRRKNMPDDYTVFDMADDTATVMETLGISRAHLCGTSQGGMIAQHLTAKHPELVSRLVLASTMHCPNEVSQKTFDLWAEMSEKNLREPLNRHMFATIYSSDYQERYRAAFDRLARQGTDEEFARLDVLIRACRLYDGSEDIDAIVCPTLVIGSMQDRVLSGEASVDMARRIGAKLKMYDGYSHAVFDECPTYWDDVYAFFNE